MLRLVKTWQRRKDGEVVPKMNPRRKNKINPICAFTHNKELASQKGLNVHYKPLIKRSANSS